MSQHAYTDAERQAIYRAIFERRDMRHFVPGSVPNDTLLRILQAAHHAPSVGFMQPWRFMRITDLELRRQIHGLVEIERCATARALHEREDEFMKLKVEGLLDCAEILVVALQDQRDRHIFGRRTMPEMDLASVSCAIQNLWLAARAEGIGVGWVSLFDPEELKLLLKMPPDSHPVSILCVGQVEKFYDQPMLLQENWAQRLDLNALVSENCWPCI